MNRFIIIAAMAAASFATTYAQANYSDATGYLDRARHMQADGNPGGCIDQLQLAAELPMDAAQREDALYLKATAYASIDRQQAKTLLRQYINEYPASLRRFDAVLTLANCYCGEGDTCAPDYDAALEIYSLLEPSTLSSSQAANLLYHKGYCLLRKGELTAAEQCYAQLRGDAEYGQAAQLYSGYIAYSKGNMAEAIKLLQGVRTTEMPGSMACFYLAQAYYSQGEWSQALSAAKQAMALNPKAAVACAPEAAEFADEALRIAGEASYRLSENSQAEKYLRQYAAKAENDQPSALYILGLYDYEKEDYTQTVRNMTPASQGSDAMAQAACLYIGQALMKQADYDGAAMSFDKALNMDFDPFVQETAYYNYAVASLQGGKVPFGSTVETFEGFLSRFPDSQYAPQVQKYVIASYFNDRNYEGALQSINAMRNPTKETNQSKQKALYLLGMQLLSADKPAEAISPLSEACVMTADPATALEANLALGEAFYRTGKYADSERELQKYLSRASASAQNRPVAVYDLGYSLFAQKKYQQAAKQFTQALQKPGVLPAAIQADAACRLGDCYYYQNEYGNAAQAYDRAYTLNPTVGDYALLQKALMEGYQRNHRQKITLLEQLQRQFPASALIPDALLEMTESYIQLGDNASAINIYKQLVAKYPNTPQGRQGYLQMALTQLNAGRRTEAVDTYQKVITNYPTSDEAAQAADALKRIAAEDGWLASYQQFLANVPGAPQLDASEAESLTFEAAEKDYLEKGMTNRLEAFVEQYPSSSRRAAALAYLLESAQDSDIAYKWASMLADGYPDSSYAIPAFARKAQHEYATGKGTLALATWQQLQQRAPNAYYANMARMGIAKCAAELQEWAISEEAATGALSSAALQAADRAEALFLRGMARMGNGDADGARDDWKLSAEDLAYEYGARSAYALAEDYFNGGMTAQAEEQAKALANSSTPHIYWMARAFILLSDIYTAQGSDYKAQQYLRSLKDNYPGSEADIFQMIEERIAQ